MKSLTPLILFGLAGVLFMLSIFGSHGLIHLKELQGDLRAFTQKNSSLESDIAELNGELQRLQTSPFAVEQRAREELGFARPGEIVYIFPNSGRNHSSTKKELAPQK